MRDQTHTDTDRQRGRQGNRKRTKSGQTGKQKKMTDTRAGRQTPTNRHLRHALKASSTVSKGIVTPKGMPRLAVCDASATRESL